MHVPLPTSLTCERVIDKRLAATLAWLYIHNGRGVLRSIVLVILIIDKVLGLGGGHRRCLQDVDHWQLLGDRVLVGLVDVIIVVCDIIEYEFVSVHGGSSLDDRCLQGLFL